MQVELTIFFCVLLSVGLPVAILISRDSMGRRKLLSKDIANGTIKHFAGQPGIIQLENGDWQALQQAKLIPENGDGGWSMDVLAESGRVWQVSGKPVKRWIAVNPVEVAATPTSASAAPEWILPVELQSAIPLLEGQRSMSQAERDEVIRYAKRLWRRPLPTAIGFTIWLSMPLLVIVIDGHLHNLHDWIFFFFLAIVTISNDIWLFTAVRQSRQLRQDEKAGYVVIKSGIEAAPVQQFGFVTTGETLSDTRPHELLPISGMVWTTGGFPASWRMTRP